MKDIYLYDDYRLLFFRKKIKFFFSYTKSKTFFSLINKNYEKYRFFIMTFYLTKEINEFLASLLSCILMREFSEIFLNIVEYS